MATIPNRSRLRSYGAPVFDETKLSTLFAQIGQLEGQEIAEGEVKYSSAIQTAYAQRIAGQQARSTALWNQIQTESSRVIGALATAPTDPAAANAVLNNFVPYFSNWLKAFFFSDATVASGSQALTLIARFSQFVAGADRYPQTAAASRSIFTGLANLFKTTTQADVYSSLYPNG